MPESPRRACRGRKFANLKTEKTKKSYRLALESGRVIINPRDACAVDKCFWLGRKRPSEQNRESQLPCMLAPSDFRFSGWQICDPYRPCVATLAFRLQNLLL